MARTDYALLPVYAASNTGPVVSSQFDGYSVADPDVYRDPSTDIYYMAYDGGPDNPAYNPSHFTTPVTYTGIAISPNGGRSFARDYQSAPKEFETTSGTTLTSTLPQLENGSFVTDTSASVTGELIEPSVGANPNSFGIGQPSVTYANGKWYMAYTDSSYNIQVLRIICSSTPNFSSFTESYVAKTDVLSVPGQTYTFGDYSASDPGIFSPIGATPSVSLTYDPLTNHIIIATDANSSSVAIGNNRIELVNLSFSGTALNYVDTDSYLIASPHLASFSFGEAASLLSSSTGQLLSTESSVLTFEGSAINSADRAANPHSAYFVEGGIDYLSLLSIL